MCIEMSRDCIRKWKDGQGRRIRNSRRMKAIDPHENEICKFLGIELADGIKTKKVFESAKGEVNKMVKMLTNTELHDVNLVRAINTKVIPVAAYSMKVCKFTDGELKELHQVIKGYRTEIEKYVREIIK